MDALTKELLDSVRRKLGGLPIATAEGRAAIDSATEEMDLLEKHIESLSTNLPDPELAVADQTETVNSGESTVSEVTPDDAADYPSAEGSPEGQSCTLS